MKLTCNIAPRKDRVTFAPTDKEKVNPLHPFRLRIGTGAGRMYIPLDFSASLTDRDSTTGLFDSLKGAKKASEKERQAENRRLNELITAIKAKCDAINDDFEREKIFPTPTQFAERYNSNIGVQALIAPYFERKIADLFDTGHTGNATCYKRTFQMLKLFDKKFDKLLFGDITLRYVNRFDMWMQKPRTSLYTKGNREVTRQGCSGNTRRYYHKALRALLNCAIKDKTTDGKSYPYGKGGFEIGSLEEATDKRYLPIDIMQKIKTTPLDNPRLECTRRMFVAQYLCYGISFTDAAQLTQKNIVKLNSGRYIVYKRQKTQHARNVAPITIPITDELQGHFDWFKIHCDMIGTYLFPIVSKDGKHGDELYKHIRSRFVTNNKALKELAETFGVDDMRLTSYVSRHTMAMTLQTNKIPREVIAQALGHADMKTTRVYLDSFDQDALKDATKVL